VPRRHDIVKIPWHHSVHTEEAEVGYPTLSFHIVAGRLMSRAALLSTIEAVDDNDRIRVLYVSVLAQSTPSSVCQRQRDDG
jgi:hypothetical protein